MKVLVINGSPRANSNSKRIIEEAKKIFDAENIECNVMDIGNKAIRGCIACYSCSKNGKCVFDDEVNKAAKLLEEADGMIIVSPVYFASPNGTVLSFLDRLFLSCKCDKRLKVGASFAVARRAGTTATFDVLNKYFTYSQMPIASGIYWNDGFGRAPGEVDNDAEGLQNVRIVARNMVFLMKSIALGKEKFGLPEIEEKAWTSFIK